MSDIAIELRISKNVITSENISKENLGQRKFNEDIDDNSKIKPKGSLSKISYIKKRPGN